METMPRLPLHCEVVPDYEGQRKRAFEEGRLEDIPEANKQVAGRCRAWLKRAAEPEKEGWRPKKRYRTAARRWALDLDHMMQVSCDKPLSALRQPRDPSERENPLTWPGASIAMDQGSDGHSSIQALRRELLLNIEYIPDASHAVWNDIKRAVKRCHLWHHELAMMLVWNVVHGPWAEDIRYHQSLECVSEHLNLSSPQECVLFQSLAPKMLSDRAAQTDEFLASESAEESLWWMLKAESPWARKGRKVSMNRFLAALRMGRDEDKHWNMRLYGYTLTCLEMDLLKGKRFQGLLAKLQDGGQEGGPTKREGPEATALRAACQDALVCAVMMLQDPMSQRLQRIIFTSCGPWEAWHAHQNATLRSAEESRKWMFQQVVEGKYLQVCQQTLAMLSDAVRMQFCGVVVGKPAESDLHPLHPFVAEQDDLCEVMGDMVLNLISSRLRRSMWMLRGWPNNTIRFLGDERLSRAGVCQLKTDYECFEKLSNEHYPQAQKILKRSCFNTIPVPLSSLIGGCSAIVSLTPRMRIGSDPPLSTSAHHHSGSLCMI